MSDVKEICDVVLADVRKELEPVVQRYEERCRALEKQVKEMQRKIDKLEKGQSQGVGRSVSEEADFASLLEETRLMHERLNEETQKKRQRVEVDMSRFFPGSNCFQYNGWIYYANKRMGNYLYRVREDGTNNQQLTDFSVKSYVHISMKVKNGLLYFEDDDYQVHTIRV